MMPNFMAGNQQQQGGQQKGGDVYEDLEAYIDKTKIQCLNEDPNFPLDSALFDKSRNIYLKSDCDEQLVIQIGFHTAVRLHHIVFRSPDEASAPDHIKLFINQQNLDFDNCENGVATQEIDLTDADFKGQTDLRFVKFQNLKHLTIFVQSNKGSDVTKISQIRLFGQTIHETNMNNLKKSG
ncbi:PITH domain protein (macronuclear) [Tetrahymena thermophila SB210]|uniref:PITH domain protein n=1 Tax=Tetrahymena thermophila (strain SB210) TaxID=312017 RepID=Q22LY6_TETTS|nr:PITH domain protein [Tetrahymena thermophila SB210]EAR86512.2 PITH domain protein [Tetrahymena thermophila SB210]|eukprot:XP_977234.2 PITH domain protein [Tetrahymena thermophila SB210]